MHSSTANDYIPNGPLLLVYTHLLRNALPWPTYCSLLKTSPAGKATSKIGAARTHPLCRETPLPCSLPWSKGLCCQARKAWAKAEGERMDGAWVGTMAGTHSPQSCAWQAPAAPAEIPGNAGGMEDDQSYGDSHLGEVLTSNSMYPLLPSLLHWSVQHAYKPDDEPFPTPGKFQGALWLQIYI